MGATVSLAFGHPRCIYLKIQQIFIEHQLQLTLEQCGGLGVLTPPPSQKYTYNLSRPSTYTNS